MRPYDRPALSMRLTSLDLAIIAAYLAGVTLFGIAFRQGQHTVRDYFLGGRTAPWWALAISIVATETSTLTIIGTPALAFSGNITFLQLVLGYLVGRVVVALVFLPHFFRGEYYTAYQLMERRYEGRDLDRRRSIHSLLFRIDRRVLFAAPHDSRRMGHGRTRSGCNKQIPRLRFLLQPGESREDIHILVGGDRGRISYDGEPWHRPDHRAAPARREV